MSPIEISSQIPFHTSTTPEYITDGDSIVGAIPVSGSLFVLCVGKPPDHIVKVTGFNDDPGGFIESQRLTPGYTWDLITLTTEMDSVLNSELGLNAVVIDGVIYRATDPPSTAGTLVSNPETFVPTVK